MEVGPGDYQIYARPLGIRGIVCCSTDPDCKDCLSFPLIVVVTMDGKALLPSVISPPVRVQPAVAEENAEP